MLVPGALLLHLLLPYVAAVIAANAVAAAYYVLLTTRDGRTLGKRWVGTRVADMATGRPPSPGRAVVRWAVLDLAPAVFFFVPGLEWVGMLLSTVVVLPVLAGPLHRGVHDRLAGTLVTAN